MDQQTFTSIISELTKRALWEVHNVMECVPDELWEKKYCEIPMWKHIYHMLHSLDLWFINPGSPDFTEPSFHRPGLNDLNILSEGTLSRQELNHYFQQIRQKTMQYLEQLQDEDLLICPDHCEYTRFTLMMAQHRHLHSHMGILMGFIIEDTGRWPHVLGLEGSFPENDQYERYE